MKVESTGQNISSLRSGVYAFAQRVHTHFVRMCAILALAAALVQAQPIELSASHARLGKDCDGTLKFDDAQAAWTPAKASHACAARVWRFEEMRKLEMRELRIDITGYGDRKWKLGEDEHWRFTLKGEPAREALYRLLRAHMDSRFAPLWAEPDAKPEWSTPAKLLTTGFPAGNWGGDGVLEVSADRVAFRSAKPGYSHTWLDKEIESAAAEPPFLLTLTVREGGETKTREFQLKKELDAARFDALWLRLNRPRGLQLLDNLAEKTR